MMAKCSDIQYLERYIGSVSNSPPWGILKLYFLSEI